MIRRLNARDPAINGMLWLKWTVEEPTEIREFFEIVAMVCPSCYYDKIRLKIYLVNFVNSQC